jgi:lysophospholipase L1-like esterase
MEKEKLITLLGASVGKAWKIEDFPKRLGTQDYRFEYVGEYQFDKTKPLRQILERKENKPDAIFLKECAAYFPGDMQNYQRLMETWIRECREAKVIPVPTTVVPVIRDDSFKTQLKDLVKRVIGRPTSTWCLREIIKYNDWVKAYARKEGLVVLDLETPLHTSKEDRSLRLDLHSGDGLHLNKKAYELLDQIVLPTLNQIFQNPHQSK